METRPLQRALHLLMAFGLVLSQLMFLAPSTALGAPIVVVNSTSDAGDASPGDLLCDTGVDLAGGVAACTLRAAIEEANATSQVDRIEFGIPSSDPAYNGGSPIISVPTALPSISRQVTIDGTTQAGFAGTPIVIVDGSPASGDVDGFLITGNGSSIRGLVVRNFPDDGIEIHGDNNNIVGNQIFANDDGILIEGGEDNTIGGLPAADRNVISSNRRNGVSVDAGHRTEIYGNYIGVTPAGGATMANTDNGIDVWRATNGVQIGPGNVISGNDEGIVIRDAAVNVDIVSNLIGTDAGGTTGLGNSGHGVHVVEGSSIEVGAGNVISGNAGYGIRSEAAVSRLAITGNRIGTNSAGSGAIPNGGGVYVDTSDTDIVGNQISGNTGNGLVIEAWNIVTRGNHIGTDAAGSSPVPNGGHGILLGPGTLGSDIGGVGSGDPNLIAFNGGDGVSLENHADTDTSIVGNSIHSNGGLGINLPQQPQVNPNDRRDWDGGPNDGLNYPDIVGAEETAGTVHLDFYLDVPRGRYLVQFFSNPSGTDPSGYGEGETLVASYNARVGRRGRSFSLSFPGHAGDDLSATATRCANWSCTRFSVTSEFSAAYTVTVGNHPPTIDPIPTLGVDEGDTLTWTPVASDADGDDLTFSLVSGPVGASVDSDSGELTWTPSEADGPGTFPFRIRATDDGSPVHLSTTRDGTITVAEVNQAPTLDPIGDRTVPEGALLTFSASAVDDDLPANDLFFSLGGSVPSGASIAGDTGLFTWTPDESQGPGSFTFDVEVSDGIATDLETITVTVSEVNSDPNVVNPGDQARAEGESVSLQINASDADLPSNILSFEATGLPPGLTIDPAAGRITGSVAYNAASSSPFPVTVIVRDGQGASDSTTFTWVTDNTNRPPVLQAIPTQTVNEKSTLTFRANATDPDPGTVFTYGLVGGPAGASIDPITGDFRWTPNENQGPATYIFEVTASDNGAPIALSASRTVTVRVLETNETPNLLIPASLTISEHQLLRFTAAATDPDWPANPLTFTVGSGAPQGVSLSPVSGVFTWSPSESQGPGDYRFPLVVRDTSGAEAVRQITIHVTEANAIPTILSPGDQTSSEADLVSLGVTAFDTDLPANDLTFSASGLPDGLAIDPISGLISGTITFDAAGTSPHHSAVTVRDSAGGSATAFFSWDVANTNRPPTLDVMPRKSVEELTPLTLQFTASDPDPATSLTFTMSDAPSGATLNPVSGTFEWTPTERQGPATYTFEVAVLDGDTSALEDVIEVTIDVTEVNTPPVPSADSVDTLEDTPVRVAVLSNDADEDYPANKLAIVNLHQPVQGGFAKVSGSELEYRPPADFHGTVEISYEVSDGNSRVGSHLTVRVASVNDAPMATSDRYRLVTYQPAVLDVLHNDVDADGDPIGISLSTLPDVGTAKIDDGQIVYDPVNGWTGAVEFEYRVSDPHGASDTATVRVVVGDEVLVGARTLADDLGVEVVAFEPPSPTFDATTLSLINMDGITLLADSFFQTVSALRVPLGFLGVTVAMVVGFGASSGVPALVFGTQRRHWAVVRLARQQRLPAYSEPGGRRVVYNYDPTAAGIVTIGNVKQVGNAVWLPVDTPNGPGWIFRNYLTEQVDLQAFADDPRPAKLVHELAERLREGKSISSLISEEGLVIALTGSPNQIAPSEIASMMGDKRLHHLPGIGKTPQTPREFAVAVAEPFLEAYDATPEITAETPHSRSALIPTECWNFPYLALGTHGHRQPWLVFFEYRKGRAWIAGLGIDE